MNDLARSLARIAPTLATLVLLLLGGFLAARWVAYFAASTEAAPSAPRERPQLGAAAQALADAHLFGVAASGETKSNLNVKLRGVFAGGGTGTGYAIVNAGDRDQATRIGGEIVPGVTLESVHADHVVLRRAGARRVNLRSISGHGGPRPRRVTYRRRRPRRDAHRRAALRPRCNRPARAGASSAPSRTRRWATCRPSRSRARREPRRRRRRRPCRRRSRARSRRAW
jgi:hypothetical protein